MSVSHSEDRELGVFQSVDLVSSSLCRDSDGPRFGNEGHGVLGLRIEGGVPDGTVERREKSSVGF